MSTAVRRSAAVCLLHALLIPRSITAMSGTAYADVRLDRRAVDRWIGDYVQSGGLAGASVAVIKNGDVVYRTDPGQEAEGIIAADRSMAIGSVSKMITGFAVLQLVDAGRIDLDQPVRRQLPEFTVDDPRGTLITVRQLLSHRSGLPNPTLIAPAASPQERVGQLRNVHLDSHPGSRYVYSNLNYHVAVRLVEVSSGQDCLGVRGGGQIAYLGGPPRSLASLALRASPAATAADARRRRRSLCGVAASVGSPCLGGGRLRPVAGSHGPATLTRSPQAREPVPQIEGVDDRVGRVERRRPPDSPVLRLRRARQSMGCRPRPHVSDPSGGAGGERVVGVDPCSIALSGFDVAGAVAAELVAVS